MFSMREKEARTRMLAVRLTDEEMAAVAELADKLSGAEPGLYTPVDAARVAIGRLYESAVKGTKQPEAAKRKR
jgi:hypothetical protein